MIDGADLSRYDSAFLSDVSAVDDPRVTFCILNCDDPGVAYKAHRANELRKPWGLYTWLYAGRGADSVTRGQAVADLLELDGLPQPPLGIWIDYEDNGVSPGDAWAAYGQRSVVKTRLGFYTYLYELNGQDGLRAVWDAFQPGTWLAYYPGNNDGSYPSWAINDAVVNNALLWQYTSSNGTRDRDTVVDEAAWLRWFKHPTPEPPPAPAIGGEMDMYTGHVDHDTSIAGTIPIPAHTPLALLVSPSGRIISTWAGPGQMGWPQDAYAWLNAGGRGKVNVISLDPKQLDEIIAADADTRR